MSLSLSAPKEAKSWLGLGLLLGLAFFTGFGMGRGREKEKEKEKKKSAKVGDDDCLSLFYDETNHATIDGLGQPGTSPCRPQIIERMTTIQKEYRFLPKEIYSQIVQNLPLVCVDIILKRERDNKVLLFLRRDEPAKDTLWWPGGRMLRGETFYSCAIRKVREETGWNDDTSPSSSSSSCYSSSPPPSCIALGVVGVWNTFFPHSSFDANRSVEFAGTQTVNVMVCCVINDLDQNELSKEQQRRWAVNGMQWVSPDAALVPGAYDKYVREGLTKARSLGYV